MSDMIYDSVEKDAPIRQGDLFKYIPKLEISLDALSVLGEDEKITVRSWEAIISDGVEGDISLVAAVRPVLAIVITQDCDTVRSPEISLCQIDPFRVVEGKAKETSAPGSWVKLITQHCRINQKWYYLPISDEQGFTEKMAVDFRTVIRVNRDDLEKMKPSHRTGRLNGTANSHFRERVGEFFRRYPYDEWYPLNKDELEAYRRNKGGAAIKGYSWQE